uniref:Plethodontid modulating factor n=1 Tax=Panagrolaimus sp. JU765 TaxID=591449 RepID=A0AC34R753_9BILA
MNQLSVLIFFSLFFVSFAQNLVLKACCNGETSCKEFKQPEEMFGIACCGSNPMNQFDEICCDGVTRNRRQGATYIDRCCGNQTLSYDQTCCQGIVSVYFPIGSTIH